MADVVVCIDDVGRLLIPKNIRSIFKSKKFALEVEKGEIKLKPLKSWDELFGCMPKLSIKDLKKMREEEAGYE